MRELQAPKIHERLATLRQKPELLAIPLLAFWCLINVPSWPMYNGSILVLIARWGTVGFMNGSTNSIFPLTYALSIGSFVYFLFRFRKNMNLDWKRSFLLSATIPFGLVALFEIAYQEVFALVRPNVFQIPLAGQLLLASWILLGLATSPFWKLTKKFYYLVAIDFSLFLIWVAIGYPQIYEAGPLAPDAFLLNFLTKFTFALTFLVLIFDGTRKRSLPHKASVIGIPNST